ncbi:Hypothetical predicted protein [Cloeon dipterum]|uniref:Uncharacterized protein n=1 Tax=Cloeon dipterum TaxID=197152 RepID=A0A8S1BZ57_9INSE|nr:Hypothetical predicted protein [Cloeon dipterum]
MISSISRGRNTARGSYIFIRKLEQTTCTGIFWAKSIKGLNWFAGTKSRRGFNTFCLPCRSDRQLLITEESALTPHEMQC